VKKLLKNLKFRFFLSALGTCVVFLVQPYLRAFIPSLDLALFYPMIVMMAWSLGTGPSLLGVVLGISLVFLEMESALGWDIWKSQDFLSSTLFVISAFFIIWLIRRLKMKEMKLTEQIEHNEIVSDYFELGVWEVDLKTWKFSTNSKFNQLFGYHYLPKNFELKHITTRIHHDDHESVIRAVIKAKRKGHIDIKYRVVWPDNSIHWLHASGRHVEDSFGRPVKILGKILDITEKMNLEQSLKEALFYREEFLSIASHELKTPLTTLKLESQFFKRSMKLSRDEFYSKDRVDRLVERVDQQVTRLVRLVDDMLDISRIRTGKLSIVKEKTNLAEFLTSSVNKLKPEFKAVGKDDLRLSVEDVGDAHFDRKRMEQVIFKLLSNAYRYGKGESVEVKLYKQDGVAAVEVKDRGIGISLEDQKKLFLKFQRAIPAREVSGFGLGLYIAKEIIESHQGSIVVESELNQGSTFKFHIPLV
jgi:PAS domain S-box-containing protein